MGKPICLGQCHSLGLDPRLHSRELREHKQASVHVCMYFSLLVTADMIGAVALHLSLDFTAIMDYKMEV